MLIAVYPDLEAARLVVPNLAAHQTLDHVLLCALARLVAHLIALKTQLGITLMRLVTVAPTQNAIQPAALIWTLLRHVAELFAIATFNGRVCLDKVAIDLILHPVEHVLVFVELLLALIVRL